MANIAYFEIPTNDIDRAKKFYPSLLGWKIEPTKTPKDAAKVAIVQYHDVITGVPSEGTLSMGGMYKRQRPSSVT
ncbi:MAG: VOC family protein [Methanomicrobiales archaeon]